MIFFQATCFISQFLNPKTKKTDKKNRLFILIFGQKEPLPFSEKNTLRDSHRAGLLLFT